MRSKVPFVSGSDTLRISVQLIATATSKQIWADRFDETSGSLAVEHDAIVRQISTIIDSRMLDAETTNSLRERPHNPNALDLLLRAWSLFKRSDERKYIIEASELLEQAVKLEPTMVPALLSLADRLIHRFTAPDTSDWGNPDLIDRAAGLLSRAEQGEPNDEWLMFYRGFAAASTWPLERGQLTAPAADQLVIRTTMPLIVFSHVA